MMIMKIMKIGLNRLIKGDGEVTCVISL